MELYNSYTKHLSRLVSQTVNARDSRVEPNLLTAALDGQATRALEELVELDVRRKFGIFFTHGKFAKLVINPLTKKLKNGPIVLDPACGAGDLLIECSKYLPVKNTLSKTIKYWGDIIWGYDIHKELIDAAKYRLVLAAINRGIEIDCECNVLKELFPNLTVADALENVGDFKLADVIVTNPPYIKVKVEKYGCEWGAGSMSMAALFIDKIVENLKNGACLAAVLPDVLRSGSLYSNWRKKITFKLDISKLELLGRFDTNVDIDVFLLRGASSNKRFREKKITYWPENFKSQSKNQSVVSDFFDVFVGPVVPHRAENYGKWHPFIHARQCPQWEHLKVDDIAERLRFKGKTYTPPFVVVRRTSSPKDSRRAICTIVKGNKEVAVENHLIILLPKSRLLRDCKKILEKLNSDEIDNYINKRNRCRHLTVGILKTIPFRL